jgi:gluconate:H+ symporter, GntP family
LGDSDLEFYLSQPNRSQGFRRVDQLFFVMAKKMDVPILSLGLTMLAGLSIAHGMTPPHPAPTLAVATFHADAGKTILYALVIGLPVGLISGPVFASVLAKFFGLTPNPKIHGAKRPAHQSSRRDRSSLCANCASDSVSGWGFSW